MSERPAAAGGPAACSLIVLAEDDTVGIAVRDLAPGPHPTSAGGSVDVVQPVGLGHKVALRALPIDEPVLRSGMVIGLTTRPVEAGAWVHTHNLRSTYIATFAHRGGEG